MPLSMRQSAPSALLSGASPLKRDMLGLASFLLACLLLLACSTYHPADPTFNQAVPDSHVVQNGAGKLGSYLSGTLFDLFGAGSLFLPVALLLVGLRQLLRPLTMPWWRWMGLGLLAATVMAMGGSDWGSRHIGVGHMTGGGFIGRMLYGGSELVLSPTGAWILWAITLLVAVQCLIGQGLWEVLPKVHRWGVRLWDKHLERMVRRESRRRRVEEEDSPFASPDHLFETLPYATAAPPPPPLGLEGSDFLGDVEERVKTAPPPPPTPHARPDADEPTAPPARRPTITMPGAHSDSMPASMPGELQPGEEAPFLWETAEPMYHAPAEPAQAPWEPPVHDEASGGSEDFAHEQEFEYPEHLPAADSDLHPRTPSHSPAWTPTNAEREALDAAFLSADSPFGPPATPAPAAMDAAEQHAPVSKHEVEGAEYPYRNEAAQRSIMDVIVEEDESFPEPIPDRDPIAQLPANIQSIKEKFRHVLGIDSDDDMDVTATLSPKALARLESLAGAPAYAPQDEAASAQRTLRVPTPTAVPDPQTRKAPSAVGVPEAASQPAGGTGYVMEAMPVADRDLTKEEELAGPQTQQETAAPIKEKVLAKAELPPLQLLAPVPPQDHEVDPDELAHQADSLTTCLANFKVEGEVHHITPGPVVTMFEYKPAPGIKISKIANLSDDLALALKALSVRIEAPIPGKDMVGVEIPSKVRETVFFRDILEGEPFRQSSSLLTMALGKDIAGASAVADLAKMPHLLVAGATGAGKSVCLNSMLLSILYKARPDQVRLLLIDPKRIELAVYADLPHLVHPVVTEMALAKNALDWAVHEMDQRYQAMARLGARNIHAYNEKLLKRREQGDLPDDCHDLEPIPYLVIIIDELADLMLTAAKEVETSVVRLAQLARAAGIHMILATQRPSVDVVTGLIKANFPCRISFQVTSKHDSRTILDAVGSERLLGKGDMLFKPSGGKLKRLHGCFVSDDDVARVVDFWKQQQPPAYQLDFTEWGDGNGEDGDDTGGPGDLDTDPKYLEAKEFVVSQGKASISLIQRRFRIGFNRAARYVEQMEVDGIVGPADGAKPRPVLKS